MSNKAQLLEHRHCQCQSTILVEGWIWDCRYEKLSALITETCKLYSRVFWIFLPNIIKIDPYNFQLYCFIVGSFSETQRIQTVISLCLFQFFFVILAVFTAQCYTESSIATSYCLSVCLSTTLRYYDYIGWKTSKIISLLVSLGCLLFADPNIADLRQGNTT